ncbi:MAG TPA: sigma-70 family RNA polymerase sigma factor [Polyangiaceae bacterium]|nr:sigma-70 family RNA polymerase sigma factor [Polyangiaceae bacterium]
MSPETFPAFYEENVKFVWRTLRRLGVREAELADATQEVFVVVYRRLGEFEGRSKATTWLFRIALNVARNQRRKAYERYEVPDDEGVGERVDESSDVDSEMKRRQGRAILQSLLDAMPIEQRAAFVLFELEGMTALEVAEALEVPVGTVASRVRRARETFQQGLARRHVRPDPLPALTGGLR